MISDRDNFDKVFQNCLELLLSGEETIDSLLVHYPEYADELRPDLEAAQLLVSWRDELAPRPGFVSASRHRVVEQVQAEGSSGISLLQVLLDPLYWRLWLNKHQVRYALVGLFVVILLFNVYWAILLSQRALPGDNLSTVIELLVTTDKSREAEIYTENTQELIEGSGDIVEAVIQNSPEAIKNDEIENLPPTIEEFSSLWILTMESLNSASSQDLDGTIEMAEDLQDSLSYQTLQIRQAIKEAPVAVVPNLTMALQEFNSALEDIDIFLRTHGVAQTATATPTAMKQHSTLSPIIADTSTPYPTQPPLLTPTSAPIDREPYLPPPTRTKIPTPTSAPPIVLPTVPSPTPRPTSTPTASETPEPTFTNTPRPTSTNTPRPTATNTPEPTVTDTPEPTSTDTPEPTRTATPEPTDTPMPTPTDTPEPTDTFTPTEAIPLSVPSVIPSPVSSVSPSPTPTDEPPFPGSATETPTPSGSPSPPPDGPDETAMVLGDFFAGSLRRRIT